MLGEIISGLNCFSIPKEERKITVQAGNLIKNSGLTQDTFERKSDNTEIKKERAGNKNIDGHIRSYVEDFSNFIMSDDIEASLDRINNYIITECSVPTYESTHFDSRGNRISKDNMPKVFRRDIFYRGIKSENEISQIIELLGGEDKMTRAIEQAIDKYYQNPDSSNNGYQMVIDLEPPVTIPAKNHRIQSYTPNRFKSVHWSMDGSYLKQNRKLFTERASLSGIVMAVDEIDTGALSVRKFYKDQNMQLPKKFDQNEFILPFQDSSGAKLGNTVKSVVIAVNKKDVNSAPSYSIFLKSKFGNCRA